MSSFDPYSLFVTPKRKTHRGQIIQQKPQETNYAITKKEIPRSLSVLQTYGYTIYSPGQQPVSFQESTIFIPFYLYANPVSKTSYSFTTSNIDLVNFFPFNSISPDKVDYFEISYCVQDLNVTIQCPNNTSNVLTYKVCDDINTTWTYSYGTNRYFVLNPYNRTSYRAFYGYNGSMDTTFLNYVTSYAEGSLYLPLGMTNFEGNSVYSSICETGHPSETASNVYS